MKVARVTTGGQVSLPAAIRMRWGTSRVVVEDKGDHVVLRPFPDDPIAAARGALAGKGNTRLTSDELRRLARAEEAAAERRRT